MGHEPSFRPSRAGSIGTRAQYSPSPHLEISGNMDNFKARMKITDDLLASQKKGLKRNLGEILHENEGNILSKSLIKEILSKS